MPTLFVGLKLRPDTDRAAYERWAIQRDTPTVRALETVDAFTIHRITGELDGDAPYDYVEVVEVNDLDAFGSEVLGEPMNTVAGELRAFVEPPMFMVSTPLEGHA